MNKKEQYRQLFTQESPIPEIVLQKKQSAYDQIRMASRVDAMDLQGPRRATGRPARRRHSARAAIILAACLFLCGGSAIAANNLLSRRARLKAMHEEELLQLIQARPTRFSRALSAEELTRYRELNIAYREEERFPVSSFTILPAETTYSGNGICLEMGDVLVTDNDYPEPILYRSTLHLPDTELTDEELLEIIDYRNRFAYALQVDLIRNDLAKGNWESRLADMTDEEIDYYYLAAFKAKTEICDGFVRGDSGYDTLCLTESETARFETLERKYKEENLFPEGSLPLIELPEDYNGTDVVICRYDAMYYIPERELTDEEILQIIDFRHKSSYAGNRITYELTTGYRTDYPKLPQN